MTEAKLSVLASGGLEIWSGETRLDPLIPAKAALMIAYLADQGAPVSRGTLAGLFWSDHSEEKARSSMRVALTRMRNHIEHVTSDRSTVSLRGDVEFDLHQIEQGGAAEALRLYRGDALAGLEATGAALFDAWATTRREEHRTRVIRSLSSAAQVAAEEGRWLDCLALARRTVEIERWNEAAHRHIMSALSVTDGRSSALAAFEDCTSILLDEFGVLPDSATTELAEAIQSDALQLPVSDIAVTSPTDRPIALRLLGDVNVSVGNSSIELGGRHRRSIMAYLAWRAPERCSVDELAGAVWGANPPATAPQTIRRHVRELRGLAAELQERIESVPDGFRLVAVPQEIDAHEVQTALANARSALHHGETEAAVPQLRAAIERWNGASLGGVAREGALGAARTSLDELRLGAIEDLIEAELALGRHRDIASEAEAFALDHPTRARAWANLMLSRARTGRRAEAVDAYNQFCESLAERDLTPPRSIETLYNQIVDDVPAIQAAVGPASSSVEWRLQPTAFSVPMPPALERSSFSILAGRKAELATLEQAFHDTAEQQSTAVFLSGEPGIGKTRLAAELAQLANQGGGAVLYGRCDDSMGVPFQAWRDALAQLGDHVPPHVARRHLDRFGASLHRLMPSLGSNEDVGDPSLGEDAAATNQRELLFRATASLLGDVAQRRRLVVVIDDMHWAHPSTVDLFRYLGQHAAEPLLLIGLYRTTDLGADHPLRSVVSEFEHSGIGTVLELDGLDEEAQADLVHDLLGDEVGELAPQIAARIAGETGGNPFFFTEVVRSVSESGSLDTLLGADHSTVIPPTVQRVVVERVSRLGPTVADTLAVSSVFGREFDLDALSIVVERSEDDVLTDLEEALTAGLITDAPAGRDRFAFAHDLVHHTLSGQYSQSRRCRLHARIADALEDVHGDDLGDHTPIVATHLTAAADPSRRDQTVRYCLAAGRHAAARLAVAESITWFRTSLEWIGGDDQLTRAQALVDLGTQLRNAGDVEHRSTLIEAGRLALRLDSVDTLVAATLANSRGMNAHVWELDEERIAMLRATLDALGPVESADRAELLASLANEQWDLANRTDSEQKYLEAMSLARRIGDVHALARVLVRVSRARNFRLNRPEMAAASDELRGMVPQLGLTDPLLVANCLTTVLNTSIRLGLAAETSAAMTAIWEMADRLPLPMFTLPAHLARCLDVGLQGDIAAYERESTETFHHATSIGDEEAGFIFEGQMFYTSCIRGDLAPLLDFSIKVMNERPDVPLYRAACTLIHVGAGKHDEARRLLDIETETDIEPSVDMFQIQALVAWADAAASVQHVEACRQLYDALIGLSTEMSGHLVQVGEPIDISLGRMATVLGHFDDAERHFAIAQEIADGYGARWMASQTRLSLAEMLERRGSATDRESAQALAAEVQSAAQQQGYTGIAARAELLLDSINAQ